MAVKLDVLINYINDKASLKRQFDNLKKTYYKSFENQNIYSDPIKRRLKAEQEALKTTSKAIKDIYSSYAKLNRAGQLSYLFDIGRFTRRRKDQKRLNEKQLQEFAQENLPEDLNVFFKNEAKKQKEEEKERKDEQKAWIENKKFDENLQKKKRVNEEEKAKNLNFERKLDIKRNIAHSKALEENKKREEALRKKQWMLLLGKWGKFGVWGIAAQQAIKYISKAVGFAYSTSMQGLDWERTIRGGASGGSWFGQGLAAYQRAGIGANQYQGFKRGIQGYLGSVKLGMGNAAPLMYLGLSALGNPDELERELERSLRRLPKDVSLALAGQMGLDYNMWEAIYSGRLDRQRSAYSDEAIQKWSHLADSLNDLITNLKVFFFNNLAPIAEFASRFIGYINKGSALTSAYTSSGLMYPTPSSLGYLTGQLFKFGTVEVVVKNEKGEIMGTGETSVENNDTMKQISAGSYTI